ncbi:CBU_0592 family membrane protein [Lutibacter sp.]|uniref:CBU_0592 family membrane protein n=1 Tax=Lutibacter sp. TaxID=1925666 RepID=UPI0039AED155
MNLTDWLGFIGVFLILLAYFLNTFGIIGTKNLNFILLNLIGSILACLASVLLKYVPFVLLEAIWAIVSLISLLKYFKLFIFRYNK